MMEKQMMMFKQKQMMMEKQKQIMMNQQRPMQVSTPFIPGNTTLLSSDVGDRDCQITAWSPWSQQCSTTCGPMGVRHRLVPGSPGEPAHSLVERGEYRVGQGE